MWILLPCINLYSKTSKENKVTFIKAKTKFPKKVPSSEFNCKKKYVVINVQKLFEHDFGRTD